MPRLPKPGSDAGKWGDILNEYLSTVHDDDGSLKDNTVGSAQLQDGAITESALASDVQTKLNTSVTGNTSPTANTIVQRTASGSIKAGAATADDEVMIKEQIDAVTAGLVNDTVSATAVALSSTMNRAVGPLASVRAYGAVGDGVTDDTAAIQALIDASEDGIVLLQGTYVISSPLEVPYRPRPFHVMCVGNVRIKAVVEMPYMVRLGGVSDATKSFSEHWRWTGGILDGNVLAQQGLRWTGNLTSYDIENVNFVGCVENCIHMEAPSHATTSIDAKLTNIRLNTVRNTAALTAVGIRADGGDWQLFDMYASSCTVFVQSAGFLQATNTHCFNGAQVASDVAFNIRSGGIFAENIYVDTIQTGITSKLANGNYASINIAVNNLFVFQYAEKPGDTNIIHSTWGSTYALNGILGSFSGSSTAHRVLRLVDSTGTPKFQVGTVVHAQNVVLQGDRDDAIRLGIYQRVQQVAISNGAHVSGGGVLIALIPPANGSEVRTQSVKFMSRPQAEDSQGHIGLYAPNSGGQFLSITLGNKYYISTSGVVLKQKTPLPNRAATYFGVKTAIMINGEQFTPVYLYSADADIGNVPTMYAEILPSNQPWLWMSNEPWETGLADASFVWTSKNLV